jgi:hypothetical protein
MDAVATRGDHVMGFLHQAAAHHFYLFSDGGEIIVTANLHVDTSPRDQIREHLGHIHAHAIWTIQVRGLLQSKIIELNRQIANLHRLRGQLGRLAKDWKRRGEGKPETFNFLGFTHICGQSWKHGKFLVLRRTIRRRLLAKLKEVKQELRMRMPWPLAEVGKWLRSVVQGYFNYHAVPGNLASLQSFRLEVSKRWLRALFRRSQKSRMTWKRLAVSVE